VATFLVVLDATLLSHQGGEQLTRVLGCLAIVGQVERVGSCHRQGQTGRD
jgi:hypothetical protein